MTQPATCRALFLAAPASGQGKTTITAALARLLKQQGQRVRVFKTGPDYLDPLILSQASGTETEQLDLWMAGSAWCQQRLYEAAQEADIILVEGVMGLHDGTPSSADLAIEFGIPLALVMNVKGMAQTVGAVALGLASYRPELQVLGVIANGCGTARHRELIAGALPEHLPLWAAVPRDAEMTLPERHLGLVQPEEITEELEQRFNTGAQRLAESGLLDALDTFLPEVVFHPPKQAPKEPQRQLLAGQTIAIARDAAFSFIYAANVDVLTEMGAECCFFSPLHDAELPPCDAIWLPGGYPELHAAQLAANGAMRSAMSAHHAAHKPILAECGGLLYCLETLTDQQQQTHTMLGLLPGQGHMHGRRGCQGMQTAVFPEGEVRAHAHHRSRAEYTPEPIGHGRRQKHPAPGEAIYRVNRLTATYLHLFFPQQPEVVAALLQAQPTQPPASAQKELTHAIE
jgi:cobyrinic acid a,c-diamide synthase